MIELLKTWQFLKTLRRNVWRSPDELETLRNRLLRETVRHAHAKVPFYRRLWDEAGVDITRFRGLADLERLPIVTAPMLKGAAAKGELLAEGVDAARCTFLDSSGSSGQPFRLWKRPSEERVRRAVGLRIWLEHGFRWRDVTAQFQILAGPSHPLQRVGIARKHWISTTLSREEQTRRFLDARANVVVATATGLRNLCAGLEAAGKRALSPRLVLCAGELIDEETRATVERVLESPPVNLYGQTEVGYVAWQCEARGAYHVNADTHLVEIRDSKGTATPSQLGNVVTTDLWARTMPIVRYQTGDLAVAADGPCHCGRSLPTIASIEGRVHMSLWRSDGRVFTTREVMNHLADCLRLGEYRVVQEAADRFRLERVFTAGGAEDSEVIQRLQTLLGIADIRVERVKPWPWDGTGKTKAVVSECPPPDFAAI